MSNARLMEHITICGGEGDFEASGALMCAPNFKVTLANTCGDVLCQPCIAAMGGARKGGGVAGRQ